LKVTGVAKVKLPSAATISGSLALLFSVTCWPAVKPVTVPPTVKVFVEQVTATSEISATTPEPAALDTVQVCPVGCVPTVTA